MARQARTGRASANVTSSASRRRFERSAPGFRERILARHVLGPGDLEQRNQNLVGGDVGGGSYTLDQVVFRPVPSLSPYHTPLRGLYLTGAATFPGGAAHGVCGHAAAGLALTADRLRRASHLTALRAGRREHEGPSRPTLTRRTVAAEGRLTRGPRSAGSASGECRHGSTAEGDRAERQPREALDAAAESAYDAGVAFVTFAGLAADDETGNSKGRGPAERARETLATEQRSALSGGQLLTEISNRVVQEFRASVGKGPSRCKSYWAGHDLLVVLLRGGFTVAEQTLFEAGQKRAVHDSQHALQEAMEGRLSEIVEDLTGRQVIGFLSASRQSPDLRAELFLLDPIEPDSPLLDEPTQ